MRRFAPSQRDLFASTATHAVVPTRAPLAELAELLEVLRAAQRLPWPDAAAILQETERLLTAAEQDTQTT